MAFRNSANGVAQKGKTKGTNLGDSGPTSIAEKGGKGGKGGPTTDDRMRLGRNLSRAANQGK
jgi:hypothetical protein